MSLIGNSLGVYLGVSPNATLDSVKREKCIRVEYNEV